jgi:hypothetical protein
VTEDFYECCSDVDYGGFSWQLAESLAPRLYGILINSYGENCCFLCCFAVYSKFQAHNLSNKLGDTVSDCTLQGLPLEMIS